MGTADEPDDASLTSGWKVAGLGLPLRAINGACRSLARGGRSRLFVASSWISWLLVVGLLVLEYRLGSLHPSGWLLLALLVVASLSTLGVIILSASRIVKGPSRMAGMAIGMAGLAPTVIVVLLLAMGISQFRRGHIEARLPLILLAMAGTSLGELQVQWTYPHQIETGTLIMSYGEGVTDPEGDVAQMEQHIRDLHYLTHRGPRGKVHWVRGKVFGQGSLSIAGLALGSDRSPLSSLDLHEVGHEALYELLLPDSDPAMVFAEGWALAVSEDTQVLSQAARSARKSLIHLAALSEDQWEAQESTWSDPEGIRRMSRRMKEVGPDRISFLRELTSPFWYHRDRGIVYDFGGAFADFVIRTRTPEQFVSLYLGVHPDNLDVMCERIFQQSPEELETAFWRDMERLGNEGAASKAP